MLFLAQRQKQKGQVKMPKSFARKQNYKPRSREKVEINNKYAAETATLAAELKSGAITQAQFEAGQELLDEQYKFLFMKKSPKIRRRYAF